MLKDRQIIAIEINKSNSRRTYDYKIIGANNDGKWDFTDLIAKLSGYDYNKRLDSEHRVIFSLDGACIICDALRKLSKQGFFPEYKDGYDIYSKVRHSLTMFYA